MDITLNNEKFKLVTYACSPKILETGDETTTLDGVTHVDGRKIKRNIDLTTCDLTPSEAARLFSVLKNPYVTATYQDTLLAREETRIFVIQNISAIEMKMWSNGKKYFSGAKISLLEKGAE